LSPVITLGEPVPRYLQALRLALSELERPRRPFSAMQLASAPAAAAVGWLPIRLVLAAEVAAALVQRRKRTGR
jgi:hypothetical protein